MAQTKKKRNRKRRGTQGGRIETKARRPRTRAEAKNRARSTRKPAAARVDLPPTWRSSFIRGAIAAVLFTVVLLLLFQRPLGVALALGAFMLVFYVPAGYFIDMTLWRRRERARMRAQGD